MLKNIKSLPRHDNFRLNQSQYGIQQWATFLTSVPRKHSNQLQITTPKRFYTSKTVHEKIKPKVRFTSKVNYQPTTPTTWIISNGSISADKEAVALAKGIQLPWIIKRVEWRKGLQWLPIPFKKLIMDYHHVVNRKQKDKLPWFLKGDSLSAPYPNYVIGSGQGSIPGLLHVSRMSGRASYSAHIHFPALPFVHFDQVFLLKHEIIVQLAGLGLMKDQKNYFRINSTLNTITPKTLESSKSTALERGLIPKSFFNQTTQDDSTSPSSPIVTVLIGGPNEDCSHNTERMVNRLARLVDIQGYRVLVSFSERTTDVTKKDIRGLQQRIQDDNRFFVYDPMTTTGTNQNTKSENQPAVDWSIVPGRRGLTGFLPNNNPYEAMLALADNIVVSADSVAMTYEALATGKPVYIIGGELARGKLKVFHRHLADQNLTRTFRPSRFPVTPIPQQNHNKKGSPKKVSIDDQAKDTSDPLSYPGDHPPWSNTSSGLVGTGPDQARKISERLNVLRDCRLAGRRPPEHIADATH